ncbi:MAG: type IV pilus modification PilV family protein [Candidatus Sumerlaeaceae bacterium]
MIGKQRNKGFSLIEVILSMLLTLIVGLAVVGGIIYSRQAMELDKQRLAALNYARQTMEAVHTNASIDAGVKTLVPFNAPGLEILANVEVNFYPVNDDGTVNWDNPTPAPLQGRLSLCRVTVTWVPAGSASRTQTVSMSTLVRAGTT